MLPSYTADLNLLAESFSDRINAMLASGIDQNGLPPATDLFTYDAANGSARTMAVTGITYDQIAAASPAAPGGNGNALDLASLTTSAEINGFTFTEYYGQVSSNMGRDLAAAREDESTQSLLLVQAQNLREEVSGIDLNEEAAALIQFQNAYQAAAQLIGVINELTDVVFTILPR